MPSEMVRRSNLLDFAKSMKTAVDFYEDEIKFQNELHSKYPEISNTLARDQLLNRQQGVKYVLDSFCERFDIKLP